MADPPRSRESSNNAGDYPGAAGDYPGAPRWVKVSGIIVLLVVLLFVILLFTRGPGSHGPGRHLSSGEPRLAALHSLVTAIELPPRTDLAGHGPLQSVHG